ncbi:GNAT family N-acetyltransferase [Vibrio neonatus]|uniref:GNAT family N-acetyltransferase n=1 Tax=Vibrio neonatus TaxID=278860 RepID=UPI0021C2E87A|nr:GNAT family N-acetyltransferase [Vibrio neonatus]
MSDTFKIRRAQVTDKATLLNVWQALYEWHHLHCEQMIKSPCIEELTAEIDSYLSTLDCFIFVLEVDESIVGFISGQLCHMQSPLLKTQMVGSIDHWFVDDSYRKIGGGIALLNRLESEFAAHGAMRVNAEVWGFNQSALSVYRKHGFQTHIHCMTKTIV